MKASEHNPLQVPTFVGQWMHCRNSDVWNSDSFPTKEEAIADGRECYGDDAGFRVGQGAEARVFPPDADAVIERMAERVYDHYGECSESFLSTVSKEARAELDAELNRVVAAWLTKHGEWPAFGDIVNIESVEPVDEHGGEG